MRLKKIYLKDGRGKKKKVASTCPVEKKIIHGEAGGKQIMALHQSSKPPPQDIKWSTPKHVVCHSTHIA